MLSSKPLRLKLDPSFILKSIHYPDPLTRRQTERFLDAVTTSFRRNLDKEHGWLDCEEQKPSGDGKSEAPTRPPTRVNRDARLGETRRLPTDHHVASILSNPLFLTKSAAIPERKPYPTEEPRTKRDPMDVFEEAVSKGLMTIRIATGCLTAKIHLIRDRQSIFGEDQQAANFEDYSGFDVSDKVMLWLRSAGLEQNLEFARFPRFAAVFVQFLVAEGREELVWSWIARLMSDDGPTSQASLDSARRLLLFLVRAEVTSAECIDTAFKSVVQASKKYRKDPRYRPLIIKPWLDLAKRATIASWRKPALSTSLFDSYHAVGRDLFPITKLPVAHLYLHHPTTPTHRPAVAYFEDVKDRDISSNTDRMCREAIMGVDAVHRLSLVGELTEAKNLLEFLQDRYFFFFRNSSADRHDHLLDQLAPA